MAMPPVALKCVCQATFTVDPAVVGAQAACPRCGRVVAVPRRPPAVRPAAPAGSVGPAAPADWTPAPGPSPPPKRRRRAWKIVALILVAVLVPAAALVVVLVLGRPNPAEQEAAVLANARTETERLVAQYLKARREKRWEAARKLTVVDEPPEEDMPFVQSLQQTWGPGLVKDSFAAISEFHKSLDGYVRLPDAPIYHKGFNGQDLAAWMDMAKDFDKGKGGVTPADIGKIDLPGKAGEKGWKAVDQWTKVMQGFSQIMKDSTVTYNELLATTKVPLTAWQRQLCQVYARDVRKFDRFLGQDFVKLRSTAPFELYTTQVTVQFGSPGEPTPQSRVYTVARLQIEGLNTGWKIFEIQEGRKP